MAYPLRIGSLQILEHRSSIPRQDERHSSVWLDYPESRPRACQASEWLPLIVGTIGEASPQRFYIVGEVPHRNGGGAEPMEGT